MSLYTRNLFLSLYDILFDWYVYWKRWLESPKGKEKNGSYRKLKGQNRMCRVEVLWSVHFVTTFGWLSILCLTNVVTFFLCSLLLSPPSWKGVGLSHPHVTIGRAQQGSPRSREPGEWKKARQQKRTDRYDMYSQFCLLLFPMGSLPFNGWQYELSDFLCHSKSKAPSDDKPSRPRFSFFFSLCQ